MTWEAQRQRLGREPITVVELDLDACSHAYGTAPCTASLGGTGTDRCFNTYATCQDKPNFAKVTKTVRFSTARLDPDARAIPSIKSVSSAPTRIDPGKGMGVRASVTVTLQDHTHNDSGQDPYLGTRSYDALTRGTFWGRLIARNKFYQSRIMRILTGYLVDGVFDAANFSSSVFVIDRIEGPDRNGQVRITGKDLLKLADDDRVQVPAPSRGKLAAAITDTATTFTITPGDAAADYPATGSLCIDSEIMTYTRSGAVFTVVRGTDGTTASEHNLDDKVQLAIRYVSEFAHDIVYDLLVNRADVPSAYIDKAAWDAEFSVWLADVIFSGIIHTPTGANELLTEITQSGCFYLWWNERTQKINLRAIRPALPTEIKSWNDDNHLLSKTVQVTERPESRVSQMWIYYGLIDPTEGDKIENYRKVYIQSDLGAESVFEYGESRIKTVRSRWIPAATPAPALKLGYYYLNRFRDNPRFLKVQVDAKDADAWTGDVRMVTTAGIQDASGASQEIQMQIIEAKEVEPGTTFEYILTDTFFSGRYAYVMANGTPDYAGASDLEKAVGCFMCLDTGLMPDGSYGYQIV